ncbi:MFS transporter [Corynebacterium mendelii]|uniref:MFS transporter n=1 Tax=Corynebacterium mendelii TaxID=2765362 RepID=A0A939E1M2_9CORY|nr:MFS transporter [Corynebacterium mendelii]MBN9645325.1 MFS transporter [Corynebacterium mendelii]
MTSTTDDDAVGGDGLPGGLVRGQRDYSRAVVAMLATGLASFNALYCTQSMLPTLVDSLGISPTTAALTVSATTGAMAVCIVPASILSERFGRGRVLTISAVAAVLIGLLLPFAPTAEILIALRAVQGVAIAGVPAVAMTWLAEEIHPDHLSRAMGVYIAGNSVGGLLGRLIPSGVLEIASWRWALGADIAVAGLFAIAMVVLLPQQKQFRAKSLSFSHEFHAMTGHWKNPRLAALFITGFLSMGAFVSLYNYVGFRMIDVFGLSEGLVGAIFLLYLSGTWSSAKAGALVARFGPGTVLVAMTVASLVGLGLVVSSSLVVMVAGILVFTAAFFAVHSTASGWIGRLATHDRAEASSVYLFCYYMGSSVVGWLSGGVLHRFGWSGLVVWLMLLVAALLVLSVAMMVDRRKRKGTGRG